MEISKKNVGKTTNIFRCWILHGFKSRKFNWTLRQLDWFQRYFHLYFGRRSWKQFILMADIICLLKREKKYIGECLWSINTFQFTLNAIINLKFPSLSLFDRRRTKWLTGNEFNNLAVKLSYSFESECNSMKLRMLELKLQLNCF